MANYGQKRAEAQVYYRLCERAREVGIPTSLDDPDSPKTTAELAAAIEAKSPGATTR